MKNEKNLIKCQKCGSLTNKYRADCSNCGELIENSRKAVISENSKTFDEIDVSDFLLFLQNKKNPKWFLPLLIANHSKATNPFLKMPIKKHPHPKIANLKNKF